MCWFEPAPRPGPAVARPWHVAAARRGDADALYALAGAAAAAAARGDESMDWVADVALAKAANAGSPEAMELLGDGHVARGDVAAGLAAYGDAARRGSARAMRRLAATLLAGGGGDDDARAAALRWLRRAARRHDTDAMVDLAAADPTGRFADAWLRRAADLGHPGAALETAARADGAAESHR